jgi:hypothetical protein
MIQNPFLKNEGAPILYKRLHDKFLEHVNSTSIKNELDLRQARYIGGYWFRIRRSEFLYVLREMENYGLVKLSLENKKHRVILI